MKKDTIVSILGVIIGAFIACLGWWGAWKLLTSFVGVTAAITTLIVAAFGGAIGGAVAGWKVPSNGDPAMVYKFNGPIARFIRASVIWWVECTLQVLELMKGKRAKVTLPKLNTESREQPDPKGSGEPGAIN